jgi:outer membrane lipoprotein-sorting protein
MKRGLSAICALALIGCVTLLAQTPKPGEAIGTWKLNIAKSKYSPGPAPSGPASEQRKWEIRKDGFTLLTISGINSQGDPTFQMFAYKPDGKDYPSFNNGTLAEFLATGAKGGTTSVKLIDDYTANLQTKNNGAPGLPITRTVSKDGKTLTLLGKNLNIYSQLEVPGTIDHLVNELKDTYNRPLPAADLLLSNSYDEMMLDVVDVKDLGSGVIGGVECDHLAFRTKDVDWQIWIAQGDHPYPVRYVITSKFIDGGPQYSIQTRNWETGSKVAATDFNFKNPTKAVKVELKDLKGTDELPDHFMIGGTK